MSGPFWCGIVAGIVGLVLLVQGLRAYGGGYRRWLDDRRRVSGWAGLGLLWFSVSPLSALVAGLAFEFGGREANAVSSVAGILFLAAAPVGWLFTYSWMPKFLLPPWARRPLDAGLDMTSLAELEQWEELVAQGWPEEQAADHVRM